VGLDGSSQPRRAMAAAGGQGLAVKRLNEGG
jgi:hypothetical protein